jgi:hypothetical protein
VKRFSWIQLPVNVLCFVAGLIGSAIAMHPALPRPYVPLLDEKRSQFLADAAGIDTVFIGSSRVYHQFIPRQFDEAMRAAGHPTHSFNLGVDGMVAPESYFAVDDFLRLRPSLRWVLIELQPIQPRFPKHYDGTIRAWWWHDWSSTLLVVRASLREPALAERKPFEMLCAHADLLLRYFIRPGTGASFLAEWARHKRTALHLQRGSPELDDDAGFAPMTGPSLSGQAAADFQLRLGAYRGAPAVALSPDLRERLRKLAAAVRRTGAAPVFVITPSVNPPEKIIDLRAQGIDADLLAFNDPDAVPSLYDPAMFVNQSHLNEAGAREFTRLLAERFAASHRPSSP